MLVAYKGQTYLSIHCNLWAEIGDGEYNEVTTLRERSSQLFHVKIIWIIISHTKMKKNGIYYWSIIPMQVYPSLTLNTIGHSTVKEHLVNNPVLKLDIEHVATTATNEPNQWTTEPIIYVNNSSKIKGPYFRIMTSQQAQWSRSPKWTRKLNHTNPLFSNAPRIWSNHTSNNQSYTNTR